MCRSEIVVLRTSNFRGATISSLRSWREWVRDLLPIVLATCAAFCTRVRDRSSRGYPLSADSRSSTEALYCLSKSPHFFATNNAFPHFPSTSF